MASASASAMLGAPPAGLADAVDALVAAGRMHDAAELAVESAPLSRAWMRCGDGGTTLDAAPQDPAWLERCTRLRAWALRALHNTWRGQPLAAAHDELLQHVATSGVGKLGGLTWFRWPAKAGRPEAGVSSGGGGEARVATRAAFHLSASEQQAWSGIAHALSRGSRARHGAGSRHSPSGEGGDSRWSRGSGSAPSEPGSGATTARSDRQQPMGPVHTHGEDVTPQLGDAPRRMEEIRASQAEAIRRLLSTRPRSATLEADLLEAARAALPSTHLQREGQRLLLRAQALLPALLALPTRPPAWVLAAALAAPFAAAVEEGLDAIAADPFGDAAPFVPAPAAQGVHHRAARGFRRIYPSELSSSFSTGGAGHDQAHAAAAGAARAAAAAHRGRASLGVLACICSDIQEFELGMALAVEAANALVAAGPATPRAGDEAEMASAVPLLKAVASATSLVLRAQRAALSQLLGASLGEAFLELLREEDSLQSPYEQLLGAHDVSDDLWPSQEHWNDVAENLANPQPQPPASGAVWAGNRGLTWSHIGSNAQLSAAGATGRKLSVGVGKGSSGGDRGAGRGSFHRASSSGPPAQDRLGGGAWSQGALRTSMSKGDAGGEPRQKLSSCGSLARLAARQSSRAAPQRERPTRVDAAMAALLGFAGSALRRLPQFHPVLQAPICLALLEALEGVLQQSAVLLPQDAEQAAAGDAVGTRNSSTGNTAEPPATEALLLHAARVACIHRLLAGMGPLLQALQRRQEGAPVMPDRRGSTAAESSGDGRGGSSIAGAPMASVGEGSCRGEGSSLESNASLRHAAVLASAARLAAGLREQVPRLHITLLEGVVGGALDAAPWASLRAPIRGAGRPSPAARLWRSQMAGLLHTVRQAVVPAAAVDMVGEVLVRSLEATLVPRYLAASPSAARLPGLCADVASVCTTAWELCHPVHVEDGDLAEEACPYPMEPGLELRVSELCHGLCTHAAALWDQQQATAPDQPASAEPQASITKAPHAASEPWDWLVPGLRSLLEGSASLWQQPVARWPFDPVTACGPSAPVGCFLAAPWLDSACAAATPVTPL